MKLRTLSCNKTLLRKDILRFAPLWAIYLIGGLLVMLPYLTEVSGSQMAYELSTTMGPFAVINMIYAALVAQMLFGDLFNSRLCNALHALPMRRETWFCTHVVAGLLYSVVPHLIAAIFFMPILGQYAWVALVWVAAMLMEYLFFFGVAVFCMLCTGNRFAMAAVYAIINFLSVIVFWFVSVIYQPMLFGVVVNEELFLLTCPVVNLAEKTDMLRFVWGSTLGTPEWSSSSSIVIGPKEWVYAGPGEGWGYLGVCAGLGVVFLVLALLLYRRRKLECAGEFVAEEAMKPVFAVIFALCAGAAVAAFGQITGLARGHLLFLVAGLVIGWFVGQMLLHRTVRVFNGKTFLRLVIVGLALALSVGLTAWDPVGITRYVPNAENVRTAELTQGKLWSHSNMNIKTEDPEDIVEILQAHKKILEEWDQDPASYRTISIRYTLKSGRQVTREYKVSIYSRAWIKIQNLYNKPEIILGETDWVKWYNSVKLVQFNGFEIERYAMQYNEKHKPAEINLSAHTMKTELLLAIWADGNAGHLENARLSPKEYDYVIGIEHTREDGNWEWRDYYIPLRAQRCQEWIKKYADVLKEFDVRVE